MKRVIMKKWIGMLCIGVLLVVGTGVVKSDAATPSKIIGITGECPLSSTGCISIPLTLTELCITSCALRSSFSYTDANRFWGTSAIDGATCRTSTDEGVTWANCTTQAFSPLITSVYAGASDGSVIAAGSVTGPLCTIRRSIDNGTNWTTVFTLAVNCAIGTSEGHQLFCLVDGRCELITFGVNSSTLNRIFRSSDNGVTWSTGETTTNTWIGILGGAAWDGLNGIAININASTRSLTATADVWANSVIWPVSSKVCNGPVIYNSAPRAVCFNPTSMSYEMYDSVGVIVTAFTLPQATLAVSSGGTSYGFKPNVMYVAATKTRVPLPCGGGLCTTGIYVSTDNLATFNLLGEISVPVIGVMRAGNMFTANGCVYMSVGFSPNMSFAKVC